MKKQIIFSIFLILIVANIFGIVRGEMLISPVNVSYDSRIVDKLQTQSEVAVIVSLKANLTSKYSPSIKNSN